MEDELQLKSCPRSRGFWVDESNQGIKKIGRIRCKSWNCPFCSTINRNNLTATVINASRALSDRGYRIFFTTLTLGTYAHRSEVGHDAQTAHTAFNRYWHALRKLVRIKNAIEYIRFLERHESGVFHIHAIMASIFDLNFKRASYPDARSRTSKMTTVRHKDILVKCGLGYQFKHIQIEENDIEFSGFYVVKYASKSVVSGIQVPDGFRRFASSRAYAMTQAKKASAGFMERIPIDFVASHKVYDVDYNHVIKVEDFYAIRQSSLGASTKYLPIQDDIVI